MDIHRLQEIVHQTRDARRKQTIPKYSPAERDQLIKKYHPDFRESAYRPIKFGPNTGDDDCPRAGGIAWRARARFLLTWTSNRDYTRDVLVVGGGGAGCAAALHAHAREPE